MFPEGLGNAIHLLAAVTWIGGLAVLVLGLRPVLHKSIPAVLEREALEAKVHRRFWLLGSVAAVVLFASGFLMMATDEHFEGIGHYATLWSKLMVGKHALFFAMVGIAFVLRRPRAAKTERDLIDLSLMLGVAILVVTGLLTAVK